MSLNLIKKKTATRDSEVQALIDNLLPKVPAVFARHLPKVVERSWVNYSRIRLRNPPGEAAAAKAASAPSSTANGDAAAFIHACRSVIDYAEEVLSGVERAEDFYASVTDKLRDFIAWAEENDHATDKMWRAVENMEAGVAKWDH